MDESLERPTATLAFDVRGPSAARALVVTHEPTGSRAQEDAWGAFDWSAVTEVGERLVRYDIRGHGRSTGRAEQADYRWPALAADLLALADRVSPAEPVDLLGVATACGTVLEAAVTAPHRVRRIVLVVPPPVGPARARQAQLYRAAADLAELRGAAAWARGAAALPAAPVLVEGGWRREPHPAVPEELLPHVVRGDADSDTPAEDVLAALPHEVLVLAWHDDRSHPVEAARWLASTIPRARLEVAERAEDVRGWGRRVAAFVASVPATEVTA